VFANWPGVATDSAGLGADAEVPLSSGQLRWADIVFVMEKVHRARLSVKFRASLNGKKVVCLDIPDNYAFMQPELVALLEQKAGKFLRRM
jgi:predicted protein tyrosine phosphatase